MKIKKGYLVALAGLGLFVASYFLEILLGSERHSAGCFAVPAYLVMGVAFLVGTMMVAAEKRFDVLFGVMMGMLGPLGLLIVTLVPERPKSIWDRIGHESEGALGSAPNLSNHNSKDRILSANDSFNADFTGYRPIVVGEATAKRRRTSRHRWFWGGTAVCVGIAYCLASHAVKIESEALARESKVRSEGLFVIGQQLHLLAENDLPGAIYYEREGFERMVKRHEAVNAQVASLRASCRRCWALATLCSVCGVVCLTVAVICQWKTVESSHRDTQNVTGELV